MKAAKHSGKSETPSARQDGRDAGGRFTKGNTVALVNGNHSTRVAAALLPEQAEVLAALREKEAAIVADLGGPEAVSNIKADLVRRYLALGAQAAWLEDNLFRDGFITAKGRTRAVMSAYLGVVDRLLRVATSLGLERRQRQAETLEQWIAKRSQEAATGRASAAGVTPEGAIDRQSSGNVAVDRTDVAPTSEGDHE